MWNQGWVDVWSLGSAFQQKPMCWSKCCVCAVCTISPKAVASTIPYIPLYDARPVYGESFAFASRSGLWWRYQEFTILETQGPSASNYEYPALTWLSNLLFKCAADSEEGKLFLFDLIRMQSARLGFKVSTCTKLSHLSWPSRGPSIQ